MGKLELAEGLQNWPTLVGSTAKDFRLKGGEEDLTLDILQRRRPDLDKARGWGVGDGHNNNSAEIITTQPSHHNTVKKYIKNNNNLGVNCFKKYFILF